MQNLVTIIIPVFNRPELISDVIKSVLLQTYKYWELIIIDDRSNDNTLETLRAYEKKDQRIKFLVRNREPKGASTCRNIGVENAKGKYLVFWDSDDLMMPWCLKDRIKFMKENNDLDFGLFQLLDIDYKSNEISLRYFTDKPDFLKEFLMYGAGWGTPAVIWRRKSFLKLSGWNESALSWQDGEIHIRALAKGFKFKWGSIIPDGVVRTNLVADSITFSLDPVKRLRNRLKVSELLLKELDTFYRNIFVKATIARIWFETCNWSLAKIIMIVEELKKLSFFSASEANKLLFTYKVYSFFRLIPVLRGIFYRLFIKKKVSNYIFFPKQQLDSIVKKRIIDKFNSLNEENKLVVIKLIKVQLNLFD